MEKKVKCRGRKCVFGLLCCFWVSCGFAQSSVRFYQLEELLQYAQKHSSVLVLNAKQRELAQLTTKTAVGNFINPRIPTVASLIDNSKQPVSFIPAEVFGGPTGTFREITMGQQYVANFSLSPQFEVLNLGNYARIQSAKINEKITETNAQIVEKNLLDQVGAGYYNILGYKAQIKMLEQNKGRADSIVGIITQRYQKGLVRVQDLNDVKVNSITIEDKIQQLKVATLLQYAVLQVLCDTNDSLEIAAVLEDNTAFSGETNLTVRSDLLDRNASLQEQFLRAELRSIKWQQLPTLSFVSNFAWQNNSNNRFFDPNTNLVTSSYWGLRIHWDLPTNVNKLSNYKSALLNAQLAEINRKHQQFQTLSGNRQLELEYQKILGQYRNAKSMFRLKEENFEKSLNQYNAGILAIDKLLLVHNELIMSESNLLSVLSAVFYAKARIDIANRF